MSNQNQTIEFSIRLEIQDWFKELFNKTFGSDVLLKYLSNDGHFGVYTCAEITVSENATSDVVEFIANTSDLLQYKLPWLGDNIYYSTCIEDKNKINEVLSTPNINIKYTTKLYFIIGCQLQVYNFSQYLNDTDKILVNKTFKTLSYQKSLFLTYPKVRMRTTQRQSSFHFGAKILMSYHGSYLQHLELEDIISLEIANTIQEGGADAHLDRDIQKYLRSKWPKLYEIEKVTCYLTDFKINEVLCYFVQKYHNHLKIIHISNILTMDEIQSLSQLYNIKFKCNNLIHIDFKSENEHESINFCAIYHSDPDSIKFKNYNSKYASENYTKLFNADDSLEPLTSSTQFTYLIIKSLNNCSPSKTNSVLKYLTNNFIVTQPISELILYEFDLNHVSKPLLGSLVKIMAKGQIKLHKMDFHLETLSRILEQSANNQIQFYQCHIRIEKLNRFRINSQKSTVAFYDMDIDLNLLNSLYNLKSLFVVKCRILTTNSINVTVGMEISNYIDITYTSFSVTTLVQLLNMLGSAKFLYFKSCKLTTNDLIENNFFVLTNDVFFKNIIFKLNTFLRIFEKCKVKGRLKFTNCQFLLDDKEFYTNQLELMSIEFEDIQFDLLTLQTILGFLGNKSKVWLTNCYISRLDNNPIVTKTIKASNVQFRKCRFETNSLLEILGQMSKITSVFITDCDVMNSDSSNIIHLLNVVKSCLDDNPIIPKTIEASYVSFMKCRLKTNSLLKILSRMSRSTIVFITDCNVMNSGSILQTNSDIEFDNRRLQSMAEEFLNVPINARIKFSNMTFNSSAQFDLFGYCTRNSTLTFLNCHFEVTNLDISNILIQSKAIIFAKTSLKLEALLKVLRRVSKHTAVFIDACQINDIDPNLRIWPMIIKYVYFWNMSIQVRTLQFILHDFTNLDHIQFKNCRILCADPNELLYIILKPARLSFSVMNIDVHVFQALVLKCANQLDVTIDNCRIVASSKSSKELLDSLRISPIRNKNVDFLNMSLQLDTLQCIFQDFTNLECIEFKNCRILCANPNALLDTILKPARLSFVDMNIDVRIFQTLVLKCTKRLMVTIDNCSIVASSKSSKELLDIKKLKFKNVHYSQDLLRLVQCLPKDCYVLYLGQLSNEAIIEICTKSLIHGESLVLDDSFVTKTLYLELFPEYYRKKAINFDLDTDAEYDLPIDIVPRYTHKNGHILDSRFNEYDWDKFKIKFVKVNDVTVKLEFMKNDELVDLFYLLNDLPDDSDECLVDYS